MDGLRPQELIFSKFWGWKSAVNVSVHKIASFWKLCSQFWWLPSVLVFLVLWHPNSCLSKTVCVCLLHDCGLLLLTEWMAVVVPSSRPSMPLRSIWKFQLPAGSPSSLSLNVSLMFPG